METKQLILLKDFGLFLENGYRNTSMSDLVTVTKMSKGAFYHYFKNKENLYHEVINVFFLPYYERIDWKENKSYDSIEIESMIKDFYSSFVPEITSITDKGMSRYFIMFFEAYQTHPEFKDAIKNFYQ